MLDGEDPAGLRLLLDAGADPNHRNGRQETALHWAVRRRRSPQTIATLLDHGAAIDARRDDGRTAYALAVVSAQPEVTALLGSRGADATLSHLDRFLSRGTRPGHIDHTLETTRLLPDLASVHATTAVHGLLAAGIPVNSRGEHGATALHWACWKGYADLVELLLARGASLDIKDTSFHADPAGWLGRDRENNCDPEGSDYDAVAKLLMGRVVRS
jgi:ankyrin repeat protein